jgi:outer membrane protein TolC
LGEEGHHFGAEVEVAVAVADALRGGPDRPVGGPSLAAPDSSALQAVEALLVDTLPDPAGLLAAIQAANPTLAVARARVTRARASSRLFAIAGRPDFSVGLQNGIRLGGREPFLSLVVGVSLPVWAGRKQSPAARAAALELQAAEQRHEDLRVRLEGELRGRMARLGALRGRVADVAGQVLPLAEATSSSALGTYGVGALDLTAALDAQDDLFRVQLRLARLVADYGAQRAALSALLGEEWYR